MKKEKWEIKENRAWDEEEVVFNIYFLLLFHNYYLSESSIWVNNNSWQFTLIPHFTYLLESRTMDKNMSPNKYILYVKTWNRYPLSYFSFQPALHDWCNMGRGMCHLVCGMMHIKEPLLLIEKSSPCGGSGPSLSLSV